MHHLPRQTRQRIEAWRKELPNHLYTPVGSVEFSGFTTFDRLTPAAAQEHSWRPFPVGEKWGAKWEYAWFRAEITLPDCCEGQRVVLLPGLGGEQLIYVDGVAAGSNDKGRDHVTLRLSARAGERVSLLMEAYAGHGARLENMGPIPPERDAIPPCPDAQCTVKKSVIALWNEDAYQLYMDVETLCELLPHLPEKSLRHQRVAKALDDFTYAADFSLPAEARNESFRKAREVLAPALSCRNGSTAPTMWLLGQSHIDLAWLWPEEETWHKVARTYANQLALMEEYPEYKFLLCEPKLLDMLRTQHPAIWARVKAAHERGQIDPEGAFYIECDTNFPSGESLIRQLVRGKRWFREHFGVESRVAFQPDTFGFTGALPQILKQLNIPYFATQKLLRADPECERFPYQNFVWEGIDGSTVQALSFFKNNARVTPTEFVQRWENHRTQTENIDTLLFPFGYGDGGGGANRDMLEAARRMADLEGLPRSHYGTLAGFFAETARQSEGNRWVGELYLSWHRGTLTTQRETKAKAARLERLLHDVELLLAMNRPGVTKIYGKAMADAWDALQFCQFHDVAGGVGIRRVHEEAEELLNEHITRIRDVVRELAGTQGEAVFNALPWTRHDWVDGQYCAIAPGISLPVPVQPQPEKTVSLTETAEGFILQNRFLSATIDRQGRVIALMDKRNGLPLLAPGQVMNDLRLYDNVEPVYDGWEMSRDWRRGLTVAAFQVESIEAESWETHAEITFRGTLGDSKVMMEINLASEGSRLEMYLNLDWQERRKLLKVHFKSNILCDDALHEIQFGHVKRPCHASHAFAADRYESCSNRWTALCEENRGFAILADSIRGVSTDRGEIALSLLRAPLVPDDTADRGGHEFQYAIMPFSTAFAHSGVVQAGYEFVTPVYLSGMDDSPSFRCEDEHVILETIKPADDGSGDIILRLYEAYRTHATATIHLPMKAKVYRSSMDEGEIGESLCAAGATNDRPYGDGCEVSLTLKPFEIVTLRVIPE